ncbi:leucine--tRNA ligase [Candidatus Roizmanbacteria bacterium]|nr:leucine--tRNA ligase [Candidatus Roizmanbacteria bacterium]
MLKFIPREFEKKWIERWEKEKTYSAKSLPPASTAKNKKMYVLDMFPYPSGAGLHVGHPRGYTATDIITRYYRMKGYAVLHPIGWDAFGLPAENTAIKAKKNPQDMVPANIANFKRQMMMLGLSYDWSRELATTDPHYYGLTQWLFIQFYKRGLLYKKNTPVYYCPYCKTGLAEEEVLPNGTHERCGNQITRKELPQWIFKITSYADSLLAGLKDLKWPPGIIEMQRNWIGKDKGLSIVFPVENSTASFSHLTVWTKYWETVFGVTFLVVSPEHEWLKQLISKNKINKEVREYVHKLLTKTDEQRLKEEKVKTGVFTGYYAVNPVSGQKIPIWVANYVLMNVGTGAVMGVPAHDPRDFEFAKKYRLPVVQVVTYKDKKIDERVKKEEMSYEGEGELINSGQFNGLSASGEGKKKIAEWLIASNIASWKTTYHLRDWIFSRQRYWGEPIPMVYCKKCAKWQPIPEKDLPLRLPYLKSYQPGEDGGSPLLQAKDWLAATCPHCGGEAIRESDTMPNWAGSCWYFLAFTFWNNESGDAAKFLDRLNSSPADFFSEAVSRWLPVDWYVGGAEHAVLHLLYARFWMHALNDMGLVNFREPFLRLRNVGMILAEDLRKMSKSFGNVINPDDVINEYGADALRLYEMFIAPFSQEISWSTAALQGTFRFLKRVWEKFKAYQAEGRGGKVKADARLVLKLNKTLAKVSEDIVEFKFNTAIAAMMEFINEWDKAGAVHELSLEKSQAVKFLKILAPFAPFTTEEIWYEFMEDKSSIHLSAWPEYSLDTTVDEEVTIALQIGGKLRDTLTLLKSQAEEPVVRSRALASEKIKRYVEGKKYRVIYVRNKVMNFVIR